MSEKQRTVVVTGASRGLGRAIALELGRRGDRVALVARSEAGLAETARGIEAEGGQARCFAANLGSRDDVAAGAREIEAWSSSVDALINNAGVIEPLGAFAEIDMEAWTAALRVNVEGTVMFTHALVPLLRRASPATIVTISSGAAVSDIPGWSAYCVGKAALDRFATVLDAELKTDGIRSFSFAPGTIDTGMQQAIRANGVGPAKLVANEIEHLPAEVPARAIRFLTTIEAQDLAGRHIDIRYPEVREALGLD